MCDFQKDMMNDSIKKAVRYSLTCPNYIWICCRFEWCFFFSPIRHWWSAALRVIPTPARGARALPHLLWFGPRFLFNGLQCQRGPCSQKKWRCQSSSEARARTPQVKKCTSAIFDRGFWYLDDEPSSRSTRQFFLAFLFCFFLSPATH